MARNPASSLAHAYLDAFSGLLHSCSPEKAVEKFSRLIEGKKLDAVGSNALYFVAHPAGETPKEELLSRARQAKRQLDVCTRNLSEVASGKLKGRNVVAHPLGAFGARLLRSANSVRFISAEQHATRLLPETDLEPHLPLTAHNAMENADLVLLEPSAVTKEGIIVSQGGRMLAELACAREIPVYALAISWHAVPKRQAGNNEEIIPAGFLTGIISEHGIYGHKEFLSRVQKAFPWML